MLENLSDISGVHVPMVPNQIVLGSAWRFRNCEISHQYYVNVVLPKIGTFSTERPTSGNLIMNLYYQYIITILKGVGFAVTLNLLLDVSHDSRQIEIRVVSDS